nr:MAG TPA: hypothetical protein [Caudoviricetes sp.]
MDSAPGQRGRLGIWPAPEERRGRAEEGCKRKRRVCACRPSFCVCEQKYDGSRKIWNYLRRS